MESESYHPWANFLKSRYFAILYFHQQGKDDDEIAKLLSMDGATQVYLIRILNKSLLIDNKDE